MLLLVGWRSRESERSALLSVPACVDALAETWELLAVEDPGQLLAALKQLSLLADAVLIGLYQLAVALNPPSQQYPSQQDAAQDGDKRSAESEESSGLAQAFRVLDFLHAAHKNLVLCVPLCSLHDLLSCCYMCAGTSARRR